MVMIFGEITTKAQIDYEKVVRNAIKLVGYDDVAKGKYDCQRCDVAIRLWWFHPPDAIRLSILRMQGASVSVAVTDHYIVQDSTTKLAMSSLPSRSSPPTLHRVCTLAAPLRTSVPVTKVSCSAMPLMRPRRPCL